MQLSENNNFKMGLRDGMPIGLGYIAVSVAFGLFAVVSGLSIWQALLISALNLTSAGQMAAVPCLVGGGSLTELALSQLVINSRYSLMAVSLSQRLGKSVRIRDRFLCALSITDEMFAVLIGKEQQIGRSYVRGMIVFPILGWCLGTFIGALVGSILPPLLVTALSVAMYAMFVAIIVPAAVSDRRILVAILLAVGVSCAFAYIPALTVVPAGFVIIISTAAVSVLMALVAPIDDGIENMEVQGNE